MELTLMTQNTSHLIWIDLEMTGLDPNRHTIIEIATVVTDQELNVIAAGPVLAIYQTDQSLAEMDEWCVNQHGKSGLTQRVRNSTVTLAQAEQQTLTFLNTYLPPTTSPMCGNSICQDRRFLYHYMPELERFFHYRQLDVSTIKELCQRWQPEIAKGFSKESTHLALNDIFDSIAELKYYRENFLINQ
jgi:oligoribonuclease